MLFQRLKVQGSETVTPDDLIPSWKILHRATKRVKLHRAVIIGSELANGNKILNKVRGNRNIINMKLIWKKGGAGGSDKK
jgi:hypothetical protein